ncbi:uncharacterized protein LOC135842561 [Planococcus citri]|uniref:uncharacterized protein LOC135842561 n=1 Tax=Planococcus citri TaxID=170843 RepID=UPI0031F7641C
MFLSEAKFLKILISTILHFIGAFDSPICSIIYSSVYMGSLLISLTGSIIGFANTHGKVRKIESFVCLYVNFEVNCMFLASILCRQRIKKLLHTMENNIICAYDIFKETAKLANLKIIMLISAHNVLAIMFVTPPLFLLIFEPTFSDTDKSSEILPYWFACDDQRSDGLLNTLCWKMETKKQFMVKVMLELLVGTMSYFGFCFCVMLYCVIIAEFCIHMRIFKAEIAKLTDYANSFSHEYNQLHTGKLKNLMLVEHNERMNHKFIDVIKYLQYLRHCVREINSTFKYYNDILITECFFGTVTVILMAFNKSENAMLFKCTAVCIHGIISYVLLCYFAQIISDTNETILNEMSTIPWYNQCAQFRKTYLMVLADTCIPTY